MDEARYKVEPVPQPILFPPGDRVLIVGPRGLPGLPSCPGLGRGHPRQPALPVTRIRIPAGSA
jgi:hypothetical protein